MTGNLTFSPLSGTAITVSTALSGPVVIDLKGFTLTGPGLGLDIHTVGVGIGFDANTSVGNTYPITIRNGTLLNFSVGVEAETQQPFRCPSDNQSHCNPFNVYGTAW